MIKGIKPLVVGACLVTFGGLYAGTASAAVLSRAGLDFDLGSLSVSGDISPYVYNDPIPYVEFPTGHSGALALVSSYAENETDEYGYYYGAGSNGSWGVSSNSTLDSIGAGAAVYDGGGYHFAGAGAESTGTGFAEAWVYYIYGFTANTTGQVDFSIDYILGVELGTELLGETASGWALAGMQITQALPTISDDEVMRYGTPNQWFDPYYVNGNDIFSPDVYNTGLAAEVFDGGSYNNAIGWDQMHVSAEVVAGETYYMVMAGYAGVGGQPFSSSSAVPEPGVLLLVSTGLLLSAGFRRSGTSPGQ